MELQNREEVIYLLENRLTVLGTWRQMLGMLSPGLGFPTAHLSTRQGAGALGERVINVGGWLQMVSAGADRGC